MTRKIIYSFLFLLLLADLGYSFMQHLSQPLDGDMAWNIVPSDDVKPILESPLGTAVFVRDKPYSNPNRFFCHWSIREYFVHVPLVLQRITQPINSVYLSCALAKILIQAALVFLLSMAVTGTRNVLKMDFMIAAVLIAPLFQTNGYRSYMGIIDPAISYTFFYALPCTLMMLFLMPFIIQNYHHKMDSIPLLIKLLWIPFALMVSLSGPLNTGIVLIFSLLVFLSQATANFARYKGMEIPGRVVKSFALIPKDHWFYFLPVSIFSLYSLFIGQYNLNNASISPGELYARLPLGVYYQFTQKLGFPMLFLVFALNAALISGKYKTANGKKILALYKWIGLFALIYILLLPLGGYRDYRHFVLRYDTIMPITLSFMFLFGISTLYLIKNMTNKQRTWYIPIIIGVLVIFTKADKAEFNNNLCERRALTEIAGSNDTIVALSNNCSVLSWEKIMKPGDSELNARLLNMWEVTKVKKLYYNK